MKLRSFVLINCIILFLILFVDGIWLIKVEGIALIPKSYNEGRYDEPRRLKERGENVEGKPVNIIVMGLDDEEVRSDVILLLNYSPKYNRMNLLSISRDTKVNVNNRNVKFNSLIGMKGEELVVEKVEELIDLPIHYYITLNFEGFRNIVNTLEGVEMDIPFDMNYDDPDQDLHIHLKKGRQLLDGEKAEQFVRYRKGNVKGEGYTYGDLDRIKAQQEFIKAFIEQKAKLKYISKADDIFFILKQHMNTNIEIGDINFYLDELMDIKASHVDTYSLPGDSAYIKGVWFFICDEERTRKLIDESFYK